MRTVKPECVGMCAAPPGPAGRPAGPMGSRDGPAKDKSETERSNRAATLDSIGCMVFLAVIPTVIPEKSPLLL